MFKSFLKGQAGQDQPTTNPLVYEVSRVFIPPCAQLDGPDWWQLSDQRM
jgi:hypothetical protein